MQKTTKPKKVPVEMSLNCKTPNQKVRHQRSSHITQQIGKHMRVSKLLRDGLMKMKNKEITSLGATLRACINDNRANAVEVYLKAKKNC